MLQMALIDPESVQLSLVNLLFTMAECKSKSDHHILAPWTVCNIHSTWTLMVLANLPDVGLHYTAGNKGVKLNAK